MPKEILLSWLFLLTFNLHAQNKKINNDRIFQLSLAPGLSTNGMHPANYNNYFSINLTSGYSNSNRAVEIGVISNLNEEKTEGLQLAGIANLTGANAFAGLSAKEIEIKIKNGFEANLSGVQMSGITNIVLNNTFGGQITGGFNEIKSGLIGFQLAGISNNVHKYSFGAQIAGGWNTSKQSMDGVQLAGLANYTSGELFGVQLAAINRAGTIDGKNSFENTNPTGFQIGLINISDKMNGFQIGLINFGKRMQGTQIGLINIYRSGKVAMTKDGTSIGLINVGDFGHLSYSVNELFFTNLEMAMGNSKNFRMKNETRNVYVENALIYGNSSVPLQAGSDTDKANRWAIGYGLRKLFFNRSVTPGMSEKHFISYGVDALQINQQSGKITRELSLLMRPSLSAGISPHQKLRDIYLYCAVSYNFYFSEADSPRLSSYSNTSTIGNNRQMEMWPGFSVGIMVH